MCARLSEENAELRDQVSGLLAEQGTARAVPVAAVAAVEAAHAAGDGSASEGGRHASRRNGLGPGKPISRRGMGKVIGAAAVGVVGATAIAELATHHPAQEDDAATVADVSAEDSIREERAAAGTSSASVVSASMASTAALVNASNSSTGAGVEGTSKSGRGGVFAGGAAQVHLNPGGSSHPRSGEMGDLYADKSGRLWYCTKSGSRASWKQIG
jgi:hypothetical protein